MSDYIVQHTPIKHSGGKAKSAKLYEVGAKITLAEEEAAKLGSNVALAASGDNASDPPPEDE